MTDTIARTHIALGRYAEAEQTINLAIEHYVARGYEVAADEAEFMLTLAVAQRVLGASDRAQASLDSCRAICAAGDLAEIAVRVQEEQAEMHAAAGDFRAAFETHQAFHRAAEELRSAQGEARAHIRHAMFETTEARQDAERFREQARRDPLTGLHNRRYVDESLPDLITHAAATGAPLTIALIDLDHFKRINDTLSHDVGDRVLVGVAGLLSAASAERGLAARLGGEEFLVVFPDTGLADATAHLDDLRTAVSSHPWQLIGDVPVTVSIGSITTTAAASQSSLLAEADRNHYTAKHNGRDQVVSNVFPDPPRRRYRDSG